MEETSQERELELREAREQIKRLEEMQSAGATSLPATLLYPAPQLNANTVPLGSSCPWNFTRQRYQPTTPVPSLGAASLHAMAYPAMAPVTPLGAFQPQQPVGLINPLGQPLPPADEFKTQKLPLSFR